MKNLNKAIEYGQNAITIEPEEVGKVVYDILVKEKIFEYYISQEKIPKF